MKKFTMFAALALAMVFALSSFAGDLSKVRYTEGNSTIHGGNANFAKAAGDTIDLMGPAGSGAAYIGDFESGLNGWTSVDVTAPSVHHWQVSTYNQVAANKAAWLGDINIDVCNDTTDVVGGYGNKWNDLLAYRVTVNDPASAASVHVVADLQIASEQGWDFLFFVQQKQGQLGWARLTSWSGEGSTTIDELADYLPEELVDGTDVYIGFQFISDGAASQGDCGIQGPGALQLDNIVVTTTQVGQADIVDTEDFESGAFDPVKWTPTLPVGVGDFAKLWSNLEDVDPCATNYSQQVAFIDDGVVVPGTGGSDCINWCYGPSGYIVTTTGGLAGPDSHIEIDMYSPVMTWPNATYDGIRFFFDAYRHEDLSADAPGIFYTWGVRSADTDDSAGNGAQVLEDQEFVGRGFVYYGGPDYIRAGEEITDLMNPGRDVVQMTIGLVELGYVWGWAGNDGYPAPYLDNMSVKVFPYNGPGMAAREIDLAQDNFPEVDAIDTSPTGLPTMHVRFDMANNISLAEDLRNDPGDSIVVSIVPVRPTATLAGTPQMFYTIDANPVFDAYRTTPTSGAVDGYTVSAEDFAFDLPDTGTLFPGDVLHYYIKAGDDLAGDVQFATMPSDLTGYGDFSSPEAYNSTFVVHALPSLSDDGFGGYTQPGILFWNDFANRGGENEWYSALNNYGLTAGVDYDIYYTNGPSSGVGNGIGGRTSGLALAGYNDMLYTSGNLGVNTISNGDFNGDAGDDVNALNQWLSDGNKDIFMTGDDVASDMAGNGGPNTLLFTENVMGINVDTNDVRSFIGNQTTPLVLVSAAGSSIFTDVSSWIAYGGCFSINTFDGVFPRTGATVLAEFADPSGNNGNYGYSAATEFTSGVNNRCISMPYDLMYVYTAPGAKVAAPVSARGRVLANVLTHFGVATNPGGISGAGLPEAKFAVNNYPNPFNPSTKIAYTIKRPGNMTLKIFNVRGELVKTLIDGHVDSSSFVMWDGTNNQGSNVSSGVYFYEARMGNDVQVNKMALVK